MGRVPNHTDPLILPVPVYFAISPGLVRRHDKMFEGRRNEGWITTWNVPKKVPPSVAEEMRKRPLFSAEVTEAKSLRNLLAEPSTVEMKMKHYDRSEWSPGPRSPDVDPSAPLEPVRLQLVKPPGVIVPYDKTFLANWLETGPKRQAALELKKRGGSVEAGDSPTKPKSPEKVAAKPRPASAKEMAEKFFGGYRFSRMCEEVIHGGPPAKFRPRHRRDSSVGASSFEPKSVRFSPDSKPHRHTKPMVSGGDLENFVPTVIRQNSESRKGVTKHEIPPVVVERTISVGKQVLNKIDKRTPDGLSFPAPPSNVERSLEILHLVHQQDRDMTIHEFCVRVKSVFSSVLPILMACNRLGYLRLLPVQPGKAVDGKAMIQLRDDMPIYEWSMADVINTMADMVAFEKAAQVARIRSANVHRKKKRA